MKRILFLVFGGVFVVALACGNLWAQATAQISGTVKDQTGAVLPGVEVTVTQTETGVTRSAVTNETGSYVLSNLPIGPYRLEAALPGFRTFVQTGIVLQVNASPAINPILEVGQVSEQVEVQANAALVETQNAGVGQVMENARILELPLNGRQVVELLALSGAATPAANGQRQQQRSIRARKRFRRRRIEHGLNYTLDGANHNNPVLGFVSFHAVSGRAAGIQGRDQRHVSAERREVFRFGQPCNKVGNERVSWQSVRVRAQWNFQCAQRIRHEARHHQTQSVRRNDWRADLEEQIVFLWRVPGHDDPPGSAGQYCICSHGSDVGR